MDILKRILNCNRTNACNKAEATGSMGTDTPLAILSDKQKLLYNYFKQNFAQVTNPAIDLLEETVMSLYSYLGARQTY